MTPTNWTPGTVVLSVAFVLAGLYVLLARRGAGKKPGADGDVADAEQRSQMFLEQLRELTVERHHLTDAQFAEEKARLELEAAQALKARDVLRSQAAPASAAGPATAAQKAASQGFFARHPQFTGALWGGGVILFFVTVGLLLGREEKPRGENDGMTGRNPMASQGSAGGAGAAEPEPELKSALEELRSHPDNAELAARVAHELIRRREFEDARQITERALGVDPFHPENRTHRAFLHAVFGEQQKGSEELRHVADTYPDSYEALLFLGMIEMSEGKKSQALEAFEQFTAEAPPQEQPPQMNEAIATLRQQLHAGN